MRKNEFMKVTRKITAATLIVMTTISLTACGKESSNDTKASLEVIATQIQTEQETEKQSTNTESSTQDNEIVIFDDCSNSEYKDEHKFTRIISLPKLSNYEYRKIGDGLLQVKGSSGQFDITLKNPKIYEQLNTVDGTGWYEYNEYKPDSGMSMTSAEENPFYEESFVEFFKKKYNVTDDNFYYCNQLPDSSMAYRAYVPKASGGTWYVVENYWYRASYDNAIRYGVWEFESDNSNFKEEFSYIEDLAEDLCDSDKNRCTE